MVLKSEQTFEPLNMIQECKLFFRGTKTEVLLSLHISFRIAKGSIKAGTHDVVCVI